MANKEKMLLLAMIYTIVPGALIDACAEGKAELEKNGVKRPSCAQRRQAQSTSQAAENGAPAIRQTESL